MLFTLEALNAKHGDALLLHYGPSPAEPRLIVIDGGPAGVYDDTLSRRLAELRKARAGAGSLKIRLLMVSHIDDDHINGVLDLAKAIARADEQGATPDWDVLSLWHNSFSDLVKPIRSADLGARAAGVAAADIATAAGFPFGMKDEAAIAIAASVGQGRDLRQIAEMLAWNVNHGFDSLVKGGAKKANLRKIDKALEFVVLGPLQEQLDALQNEWAKKVEKLRKKKLGPAEAQAEIAAFLDKSIPNLSSIAVLARSGGKTMLLTGDARGDFLLDGLRGAKLLDGGTLHVDVLKVPHHGSDRNVDAAFFSSVTADHYVVSADGKHGNPDNAMLKMLTDARGKDEYAIHLTNRVPHAMSFLAKAKKGRKFEVDVRGTGQSSVRIELGATLRE